MLRYTIIIYLIKLLLIEKKESDSLCLFLRDDVENFRDCFELFCLSSFFNLITGEAAEHDVVNH